MSAPPEAAALRRRAALVMGAAAGLLLVALMGVTVVDVIGRYVLGRPLPGATEYTEFLLLGIVFTGLPAIALEDGHIAVDLFTSHLRGRAAAVQLAAARLFGAAVLALVAWELWAHGARVGQWDQTTVFLRAPLEPFAKAAAVLALASAGIVALLAALGAPKGRGPDA
jgi:TRAP-type C4-dicarboxylate transport system permease small subunit